MSYDSPVERRRVRDGQAAAALGDPDPTWPRAELERYLDSLSDGIRALQSTDDPDLVPMHDRLQRRFAAAKALLGAK